MKQLTDKELAVLGSIGYLLSNNVEAYNLLREKIIDGGFVPQIEGFERKAHQSENLDNYIDGLLVEVATDIIEGD